MKNFVLLLTIIVGVFFVHNNLLIKISRLEREIYVEKRYVEEAEKKLAMIKLEYDKKADLKSFETEMHEKYKMEITNNINYFSTEMED
ncbi:hypothetical protein [Fusobacterium perfoetens]|uniref:hypothetical protein n=1 Tax=Fusobacterium perfoetens TaxID=852 RepID=UPI000489BE3E|nr:hypothetical protein [Fusobacterium perfoetens]MCI6152371.1 hypothetical protein [Fusobacterium perfoetens]MDY3236970.1 hypothetical protein [Fusobacterium perfoetens]